MFILMAFALLLATAPGVTAPTPAPAPAGGVIDEHYRLDTPEKNIVQENYRAGSEVDVGRNNVQVHAGGSVTARRVQIQVQDAHGDVHFHANTGRLRWLHNQQP